MRAGPPGRSFRFRPLLDWPPGTGGQSCHSLSVRRPLRFSVLRLSFSVLTSTSLSSSLSPSQPLSCLVPSCGVSLSLSLSPRPALLSVYPPLRPLPLCSLLSALVYVSASRDQRQRLKRIQQCKIVAKQLKCLATLIHTYFIHIC